MTERRRESTVRATSERATASVGDGGDDGGDRALISYLLTLRNVRNRLFDTDLFADPCWNMILEIAVAEQREQEISVTSLCLVSGAPVSTAIRRVDELVQRGYLVRRPDRKDRRRILVGLTEDARHRLRRLVRELARSEYPMSPLA